VPAGVRRAISRAARDAWRYPDPSSAELRRSLSRFLGVPADSVVTGAGADCLIDMIVRSLGIQSGSVVICPPTFGMYRFYSELAGCRVVEAPRRPDFALDTDAVESAVRDSSSGLVFLCSPNNPDGGLLPADALKSLRRLPAVLVVDEAYVEFSSRPSLACEAASSERLVVLRTFSKWAGIAGLRVGYAVAGPGVCGELMRVRAPYPVSSVAEAAAVAVLEDPEPILARVSMTIRERERIRQALATIGFLRPLPGEGNFVLCAVEDLDAERVAHALSSGGIEVRVFDCGRLGNHLRITVGTRRQNDRLVRALAGMEGRHV
jgi:histidinol-phosphate aminotransferase